MKTRKSTPKPAPKSMHPFDASVAFLLRDLGRAITKDLRQRIEPYGLSMPGWVVMRCIAESEGLSQRALSKQLQVMESSSLEVLLKLEEQGIVTRSRSGDDRRRVEIRFSPKGRALFEKVWPHAEAVQAKIMSFGTREEGRQLISLLRRVQEKFL